jgi:hypothetical protein
VNPGLFRSGTDSTQAGAAHVPEVALGLLDSALRLEDFSPSGFIERIDP